MAILCLGVPRFKSWTFADTTKLLDLLETSCVMPAEAIMTLGIFDDEGNVRVQHNQEDSVVVM
jgi:hypothetical protein